MVTITYRKAGKGYFSKENYKSLVFSGGETHVVLSDDLVNAVVDVVRLDALLKTANDVMQLLMVTDAVRRAQPLAKLVLDMPYVPYARQDRVSNPGESLSAKVFCDLINAQGYDQVTITDPHSDVVSALLNCVEIVDASSRVQRIVNLADFKDGVTLLAPDAGARKRVLSIAKQVGVSEVAFADKVRDTKTGNITGTTFPEVSEENPVLIIDDICDGGRTFIELAKAAQEVGNYELHLYVTHGIFSKGLDELKKYFARVYTGYDWTESGDPYVMVVER